MIVRLLGAYVAFLALALALGVLALPLRPAAAGQASSGPPDQWRLTYQDRSDPVLESPPGAALIVRAYQALLLAGVALIGARSRRLRALAARVPRREWLLLCAISGLGLVVRLVGGSRVPGYNNNHGFNILSELISNGVKNDYFPYHGFGFEALHQLAFLVLPRGEASVIGVQLACSVVTITGTWAGARVFVHRDVAPWAALVMALLPGPVYYGMTEVQHVPGVLFLTLAWGLAGLAARTGDLWLLAASGIFAVLAAQFHPTLLATPGVVGVFVLAIPEGRALLRNGWTWALVAVVTLLMLVPVTTAWDNIREGVDASAAMVPTPARLLEALAVRAGFDEPGNRFLNAAFTPPPYVFAALLGLVAGLRTRGLRWVTLATLLSALALTAVQMQTAQMDALRHQLAAQGFYAVAAGGGLAVAARLLRRVTGTRGSRLVAPLLAAGVGASLLAWPGPMGQSFTPQYERRVYGDGVRRVPDGCTIALFQGERSRISFTHLPDYLSVAAGRSHFMRYFTNADELLTAPASCLVYYRPAACWNVAALPSSAREPGYSGMLPECERIERGLKLEPLFVSDVPDRPDAWRRAVPRDTIRIGFFRVLR